jgi:condensin complex subunit 3
MPARATTASTSAQTRKVSGQSVTSGGRASSAAPSITIPEESAIPSSSPHLREEVCVAFADAQRSTTGHRKLAVRLRKIQESCCGLGPKKTRQDQQTEERDGSEDINRHGDQTIAEKEFNIEISRCVLRVLVVKKAEPVGDRIIRFLGMFLSHASQKG